MNVAEWTYLASRRFEAQGIESPRLEAEMLAAHVLRVDRTWLFAHPEHEFNELAGEVLAQRRELREPLAYILGWREFYGRRFRVTPDTLIPRQETELLVEWALEIPAERGLDIGTGTGCIAITLQLERPKTAWTATDIEARTVDVARENAASLGAKIDWQQTDLVAALPDQSFDLVVSNPPYVGDHEPLMPEVGQFEPKRALFSGPTGLEIYARLATEVPRVIRPEGVCLLELGQGQAEPVRSLFEAAGWIHLETRLDYCQIERVIGFRWP